MRASREFILSLPKTETHLHIEGALPYHLLHEMDPVRWVDSPRFRSSSYRYSTFPEFEQVLLDHALPWFTSAQRYHEAAKVLFADIASKNVRYIETSFHLPVSHFIKVPGQEIVHAIKSAAPAGVEVRVFAGMPRDCHHGEMAELIAQLGTWSELSGVDLHGFETMPTESWTKGVWERLRGEGKITKCHAGEFDGAQRVREAIEVLGCLRIQHGVRAIEDAEVVKLAADRGATFDVCPISNVRLQVVPSMKEHPLRKLMNSGIRCTVSTDDPLCFANTIVDEYQALVDDCAFTRSELCAIARAGWEVAEIGETQRAGFLAEIKRLEHSPVS